jgi:hypothetical protein
MSSSKNECSWSVSHDRVFQNCPGQYCFNYYGYGGKWNPDENEDDGENRNALAVRGYWQACQAVRKSVRKVLDGDNPGEVGADDHGDGYREMFEPSVVSENLADKPAPQIPAG